MNINTKALKGVIEEVEASKLRQKAEAELQREAIKRAVKQHQLDGKAIRIVLQRRAMGEQKRDEQDYYVHAYEHALGGKKLAADALEAGATIREAAAIGGISTGAAAALAKGVQKSEKIEHDAETGEVIEPQPEDGDDGITKSADQTGGDHEFRRLNVEPEVARVAPPALPAGGVPATPSVGAVASESERVASSVLTPHVTTDLEMPPIPDFLRGQTEAGV